MGCADSSHTGAPCSHRLRSGTPALSRGLWHWPHIATPSTIYFPRATRLWRFVFFADFDGCLTCRAWPRGKRVKSMRNSKAIRVPEPRTADNSSHSDDELAYDFSRDWDRLA